MLELEWLCLGMCYLRLELSDVPLNLKLSLKMHPYVDKEFFFM